MENQSFPRIHDLDELFALLDESKTAIPEHFRSLSNLTDFAVQYHYNAYESFEADPLDRKTVIDEVRALYDHVHALAQARET